MKLFVAVFLLLFSFSLINKNIPDPILVIGGIYIADKEKKELYKKLDIRMVIIEETNYKDTIKSYKKFTKEFYDKEGNFIKEETYFHNYLSLSNIVKYEHDDLGNITEVSINGLITNRYDYDENSNCIEIIDNDVFENVNTRYVREYDNQNNIVKLKKYNKDDSLCFESKYINKYVIINGHTKIKSIFRTTDSSLTKYDYDSAGDAINISEYSGKYKKSDYTWYKDLMRIEQKEYVSDTLTRLTIKNVDCEKKVLKEVRYLNNREISIDSLTYNEKKQLIRSSGSYREKIFEIKYDYDSNGNVIFHSYKGEDDLVASCEKRKYNNINLISEVKIFQPLEHLVKEIRYTYYFY